MSLAAHGSKTDIGRAQDSWLRACKGRDWVSIKCTSNRTCYPPCIRLAVSPQDTRQRARLWSLGALSFPPPSDSSSCAPPSPSQDERLFRWLHRDCLTFSQVRAFTVCAATNLHLSSWTFSRRRFELGRIRRDSVQCLAAALARTVPRAQYLSPFSTDIGPRLTSKRHVIRQSRYVNQVSTAAINHT